MSSLAFDKQGKPFAWHKRTAKLRVRLFRNPSARGTCCQVLDGVGAPLFVDADIDYTELRRAVGGVPGLYRLDQCDEDGVELGDTAPAYVSIEQLRNAGAGTDVGQMGEVSPLLIIERLVALQSDVMKTMATQHAAILAASAEIMRAPYRPVPLLPAADLRNADTTDENADEDDDDEDDDLIDESSAFAPMLNMLEPHLPRLGAFLYTKLIEFFRQVPTAPATTPPAATSPPVSATASATATASAAPRVVAEPMDVAAGYEPAHVRFVVEQFEAAINDDEATPTGTTSAMATSAIATSGMATEASADTAPSTPPMPTPEQFAHLFAVRERLSPAEQTLVEHVIKRMPPELLIEYLGALSAMSIDDATAFVRRLIAQSRSNPVTKPRRASPTGERT